MDEYDKAKKIAASYAAFKMYTCSEIFERLCRKGISKDVADTVVAEFLSAGILDDREYANAYVEDGISVGEKGIFRIRQELLKKGVAKSIIDDVCLNREEDTYKALCNYVEYRRLLEQVSSRKELEALKAKLSRRGFSLSEIKRCLEAYEFDFSEEY